VAARSNTTTTTKKDIIDRIADQTGQKRTDVKRSVQAFLDIVVEQLGEGRRLEFRDFGVFEVRERSARVAQNPKTLERVSVPAKRSVKFKPGRLMKQAMDEGPKTPAQNGVADQPLAPEDTGVAAKVRPSDDGRDLHVETRPVSPATGRPVNV